MADLTTIILTGNEEKNIKECIESVRKISKRIIVIDSYSVDKTVEIAKKMGAEIYEHKWENYASQFQYGLDKANVTTNWILRFDADERLTDESAAEIEKICKDNINTDINGIILRFEVTFLGKKLRHGGIYPIKVLRVFKNGKAKIEDRNMDEHMQLLEGKSIELINDSLHIDYKDLTTWIEKHNKYSSREVLDYMNSKNTIIGDTHLEKNAKIKRFIKFNIYYRLPMNVRSNLYYIYRYYIKLGFLDGKEGKIFAFLQAYWYRFLVDAKIYEYEKEVDGEL